MAAKSHKALLAARIHRRPCAAARKGATMTIKDIAKQAGVSVSTVSRVINGNQPKAARREVQDRIWEIARAGGYRPNVSAQALRRRSADTTERKSIACVLGRTVGTGRDAFFSALERSVSQAALRAGYAVKGPLLASGCPGEMELSGERKAAVARGSSGERKAAVARGSSVGCPGDVWEADGAVVLGRCDRKAMKWIRERFHKVVYAGLNEMNFECDQILCDGEAAAVEAMEYLLKLGHRGIGYIGGVSREARYRAYCDTLKRHGIAFRREIVANEEGGWEEGRRGALRILSRTKDVTAILGMNDITAAGVIRGIQDLGLRVPEDISVIGIDDVEIDPHMSPLLTTVRIPIWDMGCMAAATLIDRMEGGHSLPLRAALPHRLVVRGSCRKL